MKRFKIAPLVILLSLGGCTPKVEESSSSIESSEQWSAVADSDKAFDTLENALRPYLTDDKFGYFFMNVDESKPLITLDMESDEDLFSSSSTPSSTKEMKGYTVELYGKGDVSMVNCTKEHAFKAANIFNANRMAVISGGSELTSIKQTYKTYIAENKKGEAEEYEQGFYADLTQAAMSKFLVGQLLGKDDGIEEIANVILNTVKTIRNLKSELGIDSRKKTAVVLKVTRTEYEDTLRANASYITALAFAEPITFADSKPEHAMSGVIEGAEIFLPLEGLIDTEKEIARLTKELTKLKQFAATTAGKLNNERFLSKAPAQVVEAEREKLAAAEEKITSLEQRIKQLENL